MGNKQFKHIKPPTFNKDIWHESSTRKRPQKQEHGMYRLFANNYTGQEIQQYNVHFLNLPQLQKYIEFLEWREKEDNIVQTKFFNYQPSKDFCNSNYAAKVFIEHIPVRLSDIQDIPYPENIYVLHSCLDGFEKLYQSVGYFRILQDLICMDRDGKVKVWMNPNLSQCHTFESSFSDDIGGYRQSQKLQEKMVQEIIHIIQQNTTQTQDYPTISQFIRQNYNNHPLNFRTAKREVYRYSQAHNIEVPNYFQSVIGVFDQEQSENYEKQDKNRRKPEIPYFNNEHAENTSSLSEKYVSHLHKSAERLSFNEQQQQPTFRKPEKDNAFNAFDQSSSKMLQKIPSYERFKHIKPEYDRPHSQHFVQHPFQPQNPFIKPSISTATPMFHYSIPQSEIKTVNRIQYKPFVTNANNSSIKVKFNYNSQSMLKGESQNSLISLPQPPFIKKNTSSNTVSLPAGSLPEGSHILPIYNHLEKKTTSYVYDQLQSHTVSHQQMNFNEVSSKANSSFTRLTYCDSQNSYELDSEIVEDMLKYLNF